jgi:single-stranded DNA-binding protein
MFIGNAYGNLGRDWEIRTIQSGKKVASTTMAIRGLTVWNEKAMDTLKQYTFKGSPLIVSGTVSLRTWEGQNGKPNGAQIEINVQDFALGGKREDKKGGEEFDDDIPF